jgi:hypothetical protein
MLIELFKYLFRIEKSLGVKKLIYLQRKGISLAIMLNRYLMKYIKKATGIQNQWLSTIYFFFPSTK